MPARGGSTTWHGDPIATHAQLANTDVRCEFTFEVDERVALAFQVAVAQSAGRLAIEELVVTLDGRAVDVSEVSMPDGGRVHLVRCGAGRLSLSYRAVVQAEPPLNTELTVADSLLAIRQSRYCPSDALEGFAGEEFDHLPADGDRARLVGDWVNSRLRYELGSSGPLDTAVDTLLKGVGVCRDFAHLTIALCRALAIPARLVAAYAPGLSPMDFHAVAEVAVDGRWQVLDATRLAPRHTLTRIATGRDAADTAFCTTIDGSAELVASSVIAFTDQVLPYDDHRTAVSIA